MDECSGLLCGRDDELLRDVEESVVKKGYVFRFNNELLVSYDVCGNCEAHALLEGIRLRVANSIHQSTSLRELYRKVDKDIIRNNPIFSNCPEF